MIFHIFKILWKHKKSNALIIIEIFVSFLILTAVSTYLFKNYKQVSTPIGFETKNRFMIIFYDNSLLDSAEYASKIDLLKNSLENQPEILSVSFGNVVYPFSYNTWASNTNINNIKIWSLGAAMDENYAKTMNVPILFGRWFDAPLDTGAIDEVVVNEAFLKRNFNGVNMVDSLIEHNGKKKIVGVLNNYKYNGEFSEDEAIMIDYIGRWNRNAQCIYYHVKEGTSAVFEEKINKMIASTMGITEFEIKDLEENRITENKSSWVAITAMSALALFLIINVAMGLFGVLWYTINKRRHEICIRKAMGATNMNILSQFVLEAMGMAMIAMIPAALLVVQVPLYSLVEIPSEMIYTGLTFSGMFVLTMVLLCSLYPAWKASNLHPAMGLKEE
jgi:putative ABC transport system permease protein